MAASLLRWAPPSVISKAKSTSSKPQTTIEDLLDAIVPPRSYAKDDGSLFVQRIASEPATKTDVVRLQESLDQLLQQRQARETGICPIREALYSETFGACAVVVVDDVAASAQTCMRAPCIAAAC